MATKRDDADDGVNEDEDEDGDLESHRGCSPLAPEWKYPASLPSHLVS